MGNTANESVPVMRVTSSELDVDGKRAIMGHIEALTQSAMQDVHYHLATMVCAIYDAAADIEKASGWPTKEMMREAIIEIKTKFVEVDASSTMTLIRKDGKRDSFEFKD